MAAHPTAIAARVGVLALVALLATGATGCGTTAEDEKEEEGLPWTVHTISTDGTDDYVWSGSDRELLVSAPADDQGFNLRQVAEADGEPTSDQAACVTWEGPVGRKAQPGLALRVRDDDGRIRAITLTNNIWSSARHRWNVHVMDTAAERPLDLQTDRTLAGFATELAELPPTPWRLCARVEGTSYQAKVWATSRGGEPAWDDPDHSIAIEVPEGWDYTGRPGVFVGHLSPGEDTTFAEWTELTELTG